MIFAGYEVEALIGRGGMAEVFLARVATGPRAGRPVALKRLLPILSGDSDHQALFMAEAGLAARLRHPGIVEVFETGIVNGIPFIAMEYVDGADAARVVGTCEARAIRLPVPFALYIAHQVAVALGHAHRSGEGGGTRGVVHCDVSPSNIFLSRSGDVKLGDFGVARAAGSAGRGAFGKVRYLAPEQIAGGAVEASADVFALGAVLHELLTGRPAFPGADPTEVTRRIVAGPRRPPSADRPDVPPEVDAVVLRALAPTGRFESAAALAHALAAGLDPDVGNGLAVAALVRGLFGA